jgi:DNA polymerase
MNHSMSLTEKQILEWHMDVGVDECITEEPSSKLNVLPTSMADVLKVTEAKPVSMLGNVVQEFNPPKAKSQNADGFIPLGTAEAAQDAQRIAKACNTVEELEKALNEFEGCPLKRTAKFTVFKDGNPDAKIMVIGECPGTDEDNSDKPFSGQSGILFDKMFDAIGYNRAAENTDKSLYLTNLVFWRPPGSRVLSDSEIEICRPFALRHIELIKPEILVIMGGVTAKSLLRTSHGITRLRGKWTEIKTDIDETSITALPMLHPEFLLKSPDRKKHAWHDLLLLKDKLS